MEKAITAGLLTIASIVAAMALINAVIPAMGRSSGALLTANSDAADRIRTDIEIIHATGNTSDDTVTFWVKNIGPTVIPSIESSDLIVTMPGGETKRLPHDSGGESWTYSLENDTEWKRSATIKVTANLSSVTSGSYSVNFSVFNAVSASKDFSI